MFQSGQRYYAKTHEWVRFTPDGAAEVGVSEHALLMFETVLHIEPPDVGLPVMEREPCCELESRKCVTELYAPVTALVTEINEAVIENPERLNLAAGGEWIFRCEYVSGCGELLSEDAYQQWIRE